MRGDGSERASKGMALALRSGVEDVGRKAIISIDTSCLNPLQRVDIAIWFRSVLEGGNKISR